MYSQIMVFCVAMVCTLNDFSNVWKEHGAFIFHKPALSLGCWNLKMKAPKSCLWNTGNYTHNTASHPRRMDFYFTGQEGNMHSALSHSLYFIHSSRNTYVTANGENVIPLLIFESVQNICKKSGTISESIALESHLPCATVCVR